MKYAALDFTNYGVIGAILFFGGMITILAGIFLSLYLEKKKHEKASMVSLFSGFSVGALIIIASLSMLGVVMNVNNHNREIATQSLLEKYNLKSVDWDDQRSRANEVSNSGDRNIVVTTHDNQRYIFNYVMDHQTSEPTLLNMPIEGGKTPDRATTAEALLKNK